MEKNFQSNNVQSYKQFIEHKFGPKEESERTAAKKKMKKNENRNDFIQLFNYLLLSHSLAYCY